MNESLLCKKEQETGIAPVSCRKSILSGILGRKRRTASAAARGIGILKSEARTHDAAHVVDLDAVQILRAEHIHKHADALFIDDEITFARLFFDIQAVLKTRTTSGYNSHAES